jgi:DNA-binding response OmpR family regulator
MQQIFDILIDGGLTTKEIAEKINLNEDEAEKLLENLKKEGKIEKKKVGAIEYWYYIQPKLKKVLIVEDDENISKLISLTLKDYEKKEVKTAEEALKEVEEFKPDLILLDLMLPGMDGLEFCKKVRRENKDIIIIIVSAADPVVNRFFGIQYGADYYLKKPFDPMELKLLVDVYLSKQNFDFLIDLPDFERIQKLEKIDSEKYRLIKVEIEGIKEYIENYGEKEGKKILRLVSSMLRDKINENELNVFLGFIGDSFFILYDKDLENDVRRILTDLSKDFLRVSSFLKQKHRLRIDILGDLEKQKEKLPIEISCYEINLDALLKKFELYKIPENLDTTITRNYTLAEISKIFDECKLNVKLGEMGGSPRIYVGKGEER